MGFALVPVAVVEDVLTVQLDDVEEDGADVIVLAPLLIVAHDVREMRAAITIQKKPALNNMMAVSFKGDVEYYSERHDIDWGYIRRRWFVRVRVPWYQPYSFGSQRSSGTEGWNYKGSRPRRKCTASYDIALSNWSSSLCLAYASRME